MARVKLNVDYTDHKKGHIIELPSGEAQRVILQGIGELAIGSPAPVVSLAEKLSKLVEPFRESVEALGIDFTTEEGEEALEVLKALVAPWGIGDGVQEEDTNTSNPPSKMNLADLTEYAKSLGIEIPEGSTKAAIMDLIKAKPTE